MKAETYARLRKLENDIDLYHAAYDSLCKVMGKDPCIEIYIDSAKSLSERLLEVKEKYAGLQRSLLEEDKVSNSK